MKHVLGFSGGIDSQACAGLLLETLGPDNVVLMNSDAGGNEHPITTDHVEWYSRTVHPVVMVRAKVSDLAGIGTKDRGTGDRRRSLGEDAPLTFDRLAFVKGRFPSRKAQFCTQWLKIAPQLRTCQELFRTPADRPDLWQEFTRYTGVRADESDQRRDLPEREWDTYFDCELVRPILNWSKRQAFNYVKARGEKVNPLYTMGFSRVGCAPCVNSSKEDIREWAARFPEMIDKVREWEKSVGRTFFPPILPALPKGGMNWVDEVVAWSRTARGGKVTELPFVEADADRGQCVSKYGLCE